MSLSSHLQREQRLRRLRQRVADRLLDKPRQKPRGRGEFSSAYVIGKRQILRITDERDITVAWFAAYMRRRPNAHWPRILRTRHIGRFFVTWMERLYPLNGATMRQVEAADDFASTCRNADIPSLLLYAQLTGLREPWQRCSPRLRQPLLALYAAAERAGFLVDNKRTSYMRRQGGIAVLADPLVVSQRRAHRLPPRFRA